MIAKKSSLILKEFVILESNCEVIASEISEGFNFQEIQNSYPLNIGYRVTQNKSDEIIGIFVDITINDEKKEGYYISVKGAGLFSFHKDEEVPEKDKGALIQYSGVSICITNLRAFIANITSYLPFGKFNFASVDMNDLIRQKRDSLKKEE